MSMSRFPHFSVARWLVLGFLLVVAAACSSDDDSGPTDPGSVFNRPPDVSEIEWANSFLIYVDGDLLPMGVTATDADGDSLIFLWDWATTEAGGSYDTPQEAEVELSVGSTPGQYQVQVTVTDGKSNPVRRTVGITVGNGLNGGDLMGAVTWAATSWPYVLKTDATVKSGAVLTIEAGVEVQVRQRRSGVSLINQGLIAEGGGSIIGNGSGAEPITLRGNKRDNSSDPVQSGIEVDQNASIELRHFRILGATIGVLKRGLGTAVLEDGTIRDCGTGFLGLNHISGSPSSVTMRRVEVSNSGTDGVSLARSSGDFEQLMVRGSEGVGFKMTGQSSLGPATLQRCELDANEGGNLSVELGSVVDLGCSNLLPAESGYNVVFVKSGVPVGGVLSMTNCYWGISAPLSEEDIRDRTFDPAGRTSDTTWARESDLSGYRGSAISFNDTGDPCNQ